MDTIYYCYEKETGKFAGSGVTNIQNETHSCTTVPSPNYDYKVEMPYWDGAKWELRAI